MSTSIELLLNTMVTSIVDDVESVSVQEAETEKEGRLFEIKVGKDDVGKVIGKQGRIASALRTVAKAAGAKNGEKIMINVFNKPLE
jgi:predicted RNA-binding protein YlqC (UPF0109 family)|tara:strand:+ start:3029 stop:3286 length:258 start_codon:yes stop_codon:yes gene_type:complete